MPLRNRLLPEQQIECTFDESDMREGLREIPDQAAGAEIVFLAEQADIIAQGQQPIEKPSSLLETALENVGVDETKAAGQECALSHRQAVVNLPGVITHDESIDQQPLLDRFDRAGDAWIAAG